MKINLRVLSFVFVFVMLVSMACNLNNIVALATVTPQPTFTSIPTYTPQPTYTPYPTQTRAPIVIETQPPTSVPRNLNPSGAIPLDMPNGVKVYSPCPSSNLPSGVASSKCYTLGGLGLGVIYLDSSGNAIGIGASWFIKDDVAYIAGQFLAWAGITCGWNADDILGAINTVKQQDIWYTYKSVQIKVVMEDGKMAIVIKPAY